MDDGFDELCFEPDVDAVLEPVDDRLFEEAFSAWRLGRFEVLKVSEFLLNGGRAVKVSSLFDTRELEAAGV